MNRNPFIGRKSLKGPGKASVEGTEDAGFTVIT